MRYQVQIEAANIPETLAGAPLSVEIISQAGYAQRVSLPLTADPVVHDVGEPGPYLIRATLPSGRLISNTVITPDKANPQGYARGIAVLDLKEQDALTDFWREAGSLLQIAVAIQGKQDKPLPAWLVEVSKDFARRAWGGITASVENMRTRWSKSGTPHGAPGQPNARQSARPKTGPVAASNRGESRTTALATTYDWGTYLRWGSTAAKERRFEIPKLILQQGGSGTVGQLGEIPPPQHPGNRIAPCLIKVSESSPEVGSVIAWLPGSKGGPVKVALDPKGAAHRSGSALLAYSDPEDPITRTLFAYVRQGALQEARIGLPTLIALLERDKALSSPNQGLLAGYILYKLRDGYANVVIPQLRAQYPELADAHILAAAQFIADGKTEQAVEPLAAALGRGVPIYTEGVRLLREGSNFLRDLHPDEKRFDENARQAACIAAAANFASELTCLRLGDDIDIEFVK